MLIIGGIYKCKTDSYIVIIEKVNYVYCYEILTNAMVKIQLIMKKLEIN